MTRVRTTNASKSCVERHHQHGLHPQYSLNQAPRTAEDRAAFARPFRRHRETPPMRDEGGHEKPRAGAAQETWSGRGRCSGGSCCSGGCCTPSASIARPRPSRRSSARWACSACAPTRSRRRWARSTNRSERGSRRQEGVPRVVADCPTYIRP